MRPSHYNRDPRIPGVWQLGFCALLAIIAAFGIYLMASCASTPNISKAYAAEETYTSTMEVLVNLRVADKISDSEYRQIEAWRREAATLIRAMYETADTDPEGFQEVMRSFNKIIDRMIAIQAEAETR
jgi:flagellar biosynthesis/type III secretory pathway M-ring protein FliF/YscJ